MQAPHPRASNKTHSMSNVQLAVARQIGFLISSHGLVRSRSETLKKKKSEGSRKAHEWRPASRNEPYTDLMSFPVSALWGRVWKCLVLEHRYRPDDAQLREENPLLLVRSVEFVAVFNRVPRYRLILIVRKWRWTAHGVLVLGTSEECVSA